MAEDWFAYLNDLSDEEREEEIEEMLRVMGRYDQSEEPDATESEASEEPKLLTSEKRDSPTLVRALGTLDVELLKYLKKHPEQLYEINPRTFEEIVAEVLMSFGWWVNLTPKSADGGYDIFALSPNGKADSEVTPHLIECKRNAPDRKIGVEIIRSLYGASVVSKPGCMLMLATTSHFTKGADAFKKSRYDIKFKDYEGILDWLNTYRTNPNGRLYLDSERRLVVPD